MNSVKLSGRPTRKPELTTYMDGEEQRSRTGFILAVDVTKGIRYEKATFARCVAFGKTAERIANTVSNQKIIIEGYLKSGSYEKDGNKQYTLDVIVDDFEYCEPKREEAAESGNGNANQDFVDVPADDDGFPLPFNNEE